MANSYPGSGQVILDDLKVCNSGRLQPHFVSYGEHMFMNLESAHGNSYLPVVTFSRAGCVLGAVQLERASNSDAVGSYAESEMVIGTRANTPTSIQTGGVRRMVITTAGNVNVQGGGILNIYRSDNSRALQLYTTANETVIDSWESSSEPLHIRSMGIGGRIQFFTCATERLRISPAGNVGIGTCSPTSPLHLRDSTNGFVGLRIEGSGTYAGSDFTIFASALSPSSADDFLGFYNNSTTDGATSEYKFRLFKSGVANFVGNVGIGTTSPAGKMQISHTGAEGACVLIFQSTNSCGNGTIAWRSCAGITQAQIGSNYNVADSAGNLEFITTASTRLLITSAGCVGVGTASPTYKLHVNGTFYAAGSSQDYKQSICNYNTDSCMFMKLTPVTYQYKDEWCHLGKELKSETQIGLIAEDVAEVYPELAILVNEDDQKIVRNVDYEKLSIILLSEVQKLRKEVDNLKNNK